MRYVHTLLLSCLILTISCSIKPVIGHEKEPFVLSFSDKPSNNIRAKLSETGFHWWNSSRTEWAGFLEKSRVDEFIRQFDTEFKGVKKPHNITVMQYDDVPFVVTFGESPEKGKLRKLLKDLNFSWYNQFSHEWFGFPQHSDIESSIKPFTKTPFKIISLKGLSDQEMEKLTASTKASSDDGDSEDDETEIKYVKVKYSGSPIDKPEVKKDNLYPLSHVFTNKNEKDLYELSQSLPNGMNINLSLSSLGDSKNMLSKIYLDVMTWDPSTQAHLQGLLAKKDHLEIITKTPKSVFPWILTFSNLQSLIVEPFEDKKDKAPIIDDTKDIEKIAEFKDLKEMLFYKGFYSDNESVKRYVIEIFKQLRSSKKLKDFVIKEDDVSIKNQIYNHIANLK